MIKVLEQNHSYDGPAAPAHIQSALTAIGGLNPYDEPNYRLVRAERRLQPSGGLWLDWPEWSSLKQRNESKGHKPWSRKVEVRLIKRYGPVTGWVLERWVPAKVYGPPERWYASAIVGGTVIPIRDGNELKYIPSQGDYPRQGDYEYTGYAFTNEELSIHVITLAVQIMRRGIETLPTKPQARVALRASIARAANAAAEAADEKWALDVIQECQPAFGGNMMAGHGQKRPHSSAKILKKLGIKSHHIS